MFMCAFHVIAEDCGVPALVEHQLSDEMYGNILRSPDVYGYPTLRADFVREPKFGHIFVVRSHGASKPPKNWVRLASTSTRLLRDGSTELHRVFWRPAKKSAEPVKPFELFQRSVSTAQPSVDSERIGLLWRNLDAEARASFVAEAKELNKRRLALANPSELLVRHEMQLQEKGVEGDGTTVLVHYLGDHAYQQLAIPPRPTLDYPLGWVAPAPSEHVVT